MASLKIQSNVSTGDCDCRRLVERERKRRKKLSSVSAWRIFAVATNNHSSPWTFPGPVRVEEMRSATSLRTLVCLCGVAILASSAPAAGSKTLEKKHSPVYRGLYLGWLGQYNEGDEAMYHVACELFSTIGINMGISVTLYPYKPPLSCNFVHISLESYDFVVHGGGSILGSPEYQCILKESIKNNVPVVAFGTGWEASDESGGRDIIQQLADKKFQPRKDDLNLKNDVEDRLITALKSYKYGGFRGLYTKAVADMFHPQGKNRILGDSGVLANRLRRAYGGGSEASKTPYERWGITRNVLPIVAINYGQNGLDPAIFHSNTDVLRDSFIDVGASLAKFGYNVYYYAMAANDLQHVEHVYLKTIEVLHTLRKAHEIDFAPENRVHMMRYIPDTVHILNLLGDAHFSVNYKLHGNVLSAAAETPFISVCYHLKGLEFSRYIDESIEKKYSIRSDTINSAEDFENALASLHEDGEMERFRALLKQSIDSTSSRYNEMVMQILKDIVIRKFRASV